MFSFPCQLLALEKEENKEKRRRKKKESKKEEKHQHGCKINLFRFKTI